MLQRTSLVAVMMLMSVAACGGGGGSDETAVSSSPPAPSPSPSPSTAPTPDAAATPAPGPSAGPAPAPGGASPVPAAPSAPTVPGTAVRAALEAGVSPDPAPENPTTDFRKVAAGPGTYYYLGDALMSHSMGVGPSGPRPAAVVDIRPQMNNGVITSVKANGLDLAGSPLDLRFANLPIGEEAATWSSGSSSVALKVVSVNGQPNLMRVCWDVNLPSSERVEPMKRLMCGVYDINQPGKDVGGYMEDTIGSNKTTYVGTW